MEGSETAMQYQRLSVLDTFVCIGPKCPDSCCRRWQMDVDAATLARWREAQPAETARWLLDSIDPDSDPRRPVLRRRADGGCVHHGADGLCAVQSALGHSWLPQTCQEYPRATVSNADTRLETANLSCPEIVALLQRQFHVGQAPFQVSGAPGSSAPGDELAALRRLLNDYVDTVMAWDGPLGVRLYDVAGVLTYLSRKAAAGNLPRADLANKTGHTPEAVHQRLARIARHRQSGKLPVNAAVRQRFWLHVMASGEALRKEWAHGHLEAAGVPALLDARNGAKSWQVFVQRAQAELMATHPDAVAFLERYLEIKFRNHGFPWNPFAGNYTVTFLDCLLPYGQCLLLSWTITARGAALDDEVLQRVVYTVEKHVSHNTRIFDYLQRNPWLLQPQCYREALLELG